MKSKAYLEKTRAEFDRLARIEIAFVRQMASHGRPWKRTSVMVLNRLGNGWLYGVILAALLWFHPENVAWVIVAAALAAGCAHFAYHWIKRLTARPRPCDVDPSLKPLLNTLDKYSFPSGHCMTVTCVSIPVVAAYPEFAAFAVVLWLLIAWSRLATGHHYPSDLLAGTVLGAIIALTITNLLI